MVSILSSGTKRRSRRKLKGVVKILYLNILFIAAFEWFSYRKLFAGVRDPLESVVADGGHQPLPPTAKAIHHRDEGSLTQQQPSTCAILLFGLPRAFRKFVLPSLEKNVIAPNVKYGCDFFVHYFEQDFEAGGRSGRGGVIQSEDIFLLEASVKKLYDSSIKASATAKPEVAFVSDTNETFWEKRGAVIQHYRTAKNPNGKYSFFPFNEPTYEYPWTLDNIVKQWHSINAAWDAMEESSTKKGSFNNKPHQYRRVAMIRNDVVYLTPIDIYSVPVDNPSEKAVGATHQTRDDYFTNSVSVIPDFNKWPVNDRLIYGPHSAVKFWASERFSKIEEYARDPSAVPGMVMHSETFLNASILQAIRETPVEVDDAFASDAIIAKTDRANTYKVLEDKWMCFLRVRADGAIWIEDCDKSKSGFGGGYPGGLSSYTKLLQEFLPNQGKGCRKRRVRDNLRIIIELFCRNKTAVSSRALPVF